MKNQVEHFIFVPGIGAGKRHPAGILINRGIEDLSRGEVTTEIADTCQEVDEFIVPSPFEQQADNLARSIRRKKGQVAIFAHSQGSIPAALALNQYHLPQVDKSRVVFAAPPLNADESRTRAIGRITDNPEKYKLARARLKLARQTLGGIIESKVSQRYLVLTDQHLESYPTHEEHLNHLRNLGASTILIAGEERVTDCTIANIERMLPERSEVCDSNDTESRSKTILIRGAPHNLRGFCEDHVPELLMRRIIST